MDIAFQSRGESPLTVNLKACNQYKLFNGKVAESEFRPVVDNGNLESNTSVGAILRHNKVVFRNGEGMRSLSLFLQFINQCTKWLSGHDIIYTN